MEKLKKRCDNVKWCMKAHENSKDFNSFYDLSKKDMSIGIHYSICEDITHLKTLDEISDKLKIDGRSLKQITQINNFINEINVGDTIIIGQGKCDGKEDKNSPTGYKRLFVATVATNAYFDKRDIWSNGDLSVGVYTRRKVKDIVELPAGSKLEGLREKFVTLSKQECGSFGIVFGNIN